MGLGTSGAIPSCQGLDCGHVQESRSSGQNLADSWGWARDEGVLMAL